jgi:pentatricopeptide repeat domain-containing protein 1
VITYTRQISELGKRRQWAQALDLFEAMQRQGVVPDVITYSALISACEKGQEPERALELFEAMQRQGVVPDVMPESTLWVLGGKGACTR